MPIQISIPRLGWSMDEGSFVGWLKRDGERVQSGEPLFTLENEKAAQDVEAIDSGILRIPEDAPKTGDTVKVGQIIGHLFADDESSESVAIASKESPDGQESVREIRLDRGSKVVSKDLLPATDIQRQPAKAPAISPRARRRAAELGVDATRLQGSGRTGRIVEADVVKNAKTGSSAGLTIMRRTIAQRTSESFSSTPHFYLRCELDATALIRLREDLLPEIESRTGVRLTLTDLILRAQAMALRDFSAANAVWGDDRIVSLPGCDVGLVVGLPEGLMIPIVRSPDADELAALAKQRSFLVEAARSGSLALEALQGGVTSLSNLGNTRVDEFAAVILPGQSSMLAVGRASPRPYAMNGKLAIRTTMRLCLSVDHRVLDGAPAAEFLGLIIQLLEEPEKLV